MGTYSQVLGTGTWTSLGATISLPALVIELFLSHLISHVVTEVSSATSEACVLNEVMLGLFGVEFPAPSWGLAHSSEQKLCLVEGLFPLDPPLPAEGTRQGS